MIVFLFLVVKLKLVFFDLFAGRHGRADRAAAQRAQAAAGVGREPVLGSSEYEKEFEISTRQPPLDRFKIALRVSSEAFFFSNSDIAEICSETLKSHEY